jgi:Tfp pilus assembly protein PilV
MPVNRVQRRGERGIGLSSDRGVGLVETLIAVAIVTIAITAFLAVLSTGSMAVQKSDGRTTAENLARTQMEYTKGLAYLTAPASYATIAAPSGYSISADAASISGRAADIQRITVTVTYGGNTFTMEGFKTDR